MRIFDLYCMCTVRMLVNFIDRILGISFSGFINLLSFFFHLTHGTIFSTKRHANTFLFAFASKLRIIAMNEIVNILTCRIRRL
ncbi:MAG: hypothetical protein EB010_14375 [Acidimicrobiia bacterium]|nr:hypothetical protein [Actinomycetota bacterium]NDE60568.1 hypothetical protein [Acidimicrobiia bacterium]NDE80766.1 hypothetical protein [Actinomycetota bacterium]